MRIILAGLILLLSVAGWTADKFQPLNVKVGLWETTATTRTSGAMPVPDELLAKLTPEQRAQVEEKMKSSPEKTRTTTSKSCITKEDLEKGAKFGEVSKECSQTIVTSTSSKLEMRFACQSPEGSANGTLAFQALSPESVKGTGEGSVSGGGHTMKTNTTFTSKWIGPVCSKSKE